MEGACEVSTVEQINRGKAKKTVRWSKSCSRRGLPGSRPCWCRRRLRSAPFWLISCAGRVSADGPLFSCFYCLVLLIRVTCFQQTNLTLALTSSAHREPNASPPPTPVRPPASAQPSKLKTFSLLYALNSLLQFTSLLDQVDLSNLTTLSRGPITKRVWPCKNTKVR